MIRAAVLTVSLALVGVAAAAQVPPEIAAQVRAAGQTMDPTSVQGYAAMFPAEAWQGVTIERDLAYGPDPLHRLDAYTTPGGTRRPVLLFVHGGGYTRGDKHGAFYPDNITLWAAKHGMVALNINYRLAPQTTFPGAAEDVARAIAWARANVARYGGDPGRIILFGHSAGANHVADYVGNPQVQGQELAAVRGAVLLSPTYPAFPGDIPHAYYGADIEVNSPAGSIRRLRASTVPLFLADAEFDPPLMQDTASALRRELCEAPARCPRSVHLEDHNHFTEGQAIGTADRSLTGPLLEWMNSLFGERG